MTAVPALAALGVLAEVEDELRPGLEPLDVSPGLLGFLVVFAMVLACIPLFRSMSGKLRGVDHRAPDRDDDGEERAEGGTDSQRAPGPRDGGPGDGGVGDEDAGRGR
ncbi:hypothetical protein GXB85_09425 [Cellulomonas sp. APG4]|uniref:hypothetical protein n=1 Tax=Cellulomonas sp. APG4 TaxID=1538656 RepID=UPI001379F03C|nr:hypothetical protein [Cellulomonas sp. APG4]NCT91169.1 hypothetical protein [Cellulomonas sp. APG4]